MNERLTDRANGAPCSPATPPSRSSPPTPPSSTSSPRARRSRHLGRAAPRARGQRRSGRSPTHRRRRRTPARCRPRPRAPRERKENRRGRGFLVAALGAAASIAIVVGALALTGDAHRAPTTRRTSPPPALAPDAHAAADVTRNTAGFRVELDAHGLRPLDRGAYYQAWLKNGHGGLVSIGTFSSSDGIDRAVVGRGPEGVPRHHGDDRARRRQPGVVRAAGARRPAARDLTTDRLSAWW